ncbi:hypothetical protein ACHAPT_006337 [Fusarium lateritium]
MITIEDESVIDEFANFCKKNNQPRHIRDDGRIVYLSDSDFGEIKGPKLFPNLSDFNTCFRQASGKNVNIRAIQSHSYRAPEVFLGYLWTESVDIWNLGLLMWNMLEDVNLFGRPASEDGEYDAHVHLAKMVSLLGPPPAEVIEAERYFRKDHFKRPITNPKGKECTTMNEYWGGPFFDDNDQIYRADLVRDGRTLDDMVTELAGQEKEAFLDFARNMLQWTPADRMTAKELLHHPFFDSLKESLDKIRRRKVQYDI